VNLSHHRTGSGRLLLVCNDISFVFRMTSPVPEIGFATLASTPSYRPNGVPSYRYVSGTVRSLVFDVAGGIPRPRRREAVFWIRESVNEYPASYRAADSASRRGCAVTEEQALSRKTFDVARVVVDQKIRRDNLLSPRRRCGSRERTGSVSDPLIFGGKRRRVFHGGCRDESFLAFEQKEGAPRCCLA
jgi:hypothetical protein